MAKMRMFDAKYAAIDLLKDTHAINITWRSFVNVSQYKLVIELVLQLLRKHQIMTISEDQTAMQSSNMHDIQQYFTSSVFSRLNAMEVKNYVLKVSDNAQQGFNPEEVKTATQKYPIQLDLIATQVAA
jgi:hypothetical protein